MKREETYETGFAVPPLHVPWGTNRTRFVSDTKGIRPSDES